MKLEAPETLFASFAHGCFQADPDVRFDAIRRMFKRRYPVEWAVLTAQLMSAPAKAVA